MGNEFSFSPLTRKAKLCYGYGRWRRQMLRCLRARKTRTRHSGRLIVDRSAISPTGSFSNLTLRAAEHKRYVTQTLSAEPGMLKVPSYSTATTGYIESPVMADLRCSQPRLILKKRATVGPISFPIDVTSFFSPMQRKQRTTIF